MTRWMKTLLAMALVMVVMLGAGFAVQADAAGPMWVRNLGSDHGESLKIKDVCYE